MGLQTQTCAEPNGILRCIRESISSSRIAAVPHACLGHCGRDYNCPLTVQQSLSYPMGYEALRLRDTCPAGAMYDAIGRSFSIARCNGRFFEA